MVYLKEMNDLLSKGDYQALVLEAKKNLVIEPSNPYLYYYLFLAKNKDYMNMDFISPLEMNSYNQALSFASDSFKGEMYNEFNFFKELSKEFREIFCYAIRNRIDLFTNKVLTFNTNELDTLDISKIAFHLDNLLSLKRSNDVSKMLLYSINLLYIITESNTFIDMYGLYKRKCLNSGFEFGDIRFFYTYLELKDYIRSKKEMKASEIKPAGTIPYAKGQSNAQSLKFKYRGSYDKWDTFAMVGKILGIVGFITGFIIIGVGFGIPGIVFSALGKKSRNSDTNGSTIGLVLSILSIVVSFFAYIALITFIVNLVTRF